MTFKTKLIKRKKKIEKKEREKRKKDEFIELFKEESKFSTIEVDLVNSYRLN